jgi:hypothetical protein
MYISIGVGFFLNGALLNSGSVVSPSDIGEGSSALYCLTDETECCGVTTGGADGGEWRFPEGGLVGENTLTGVYFTRGFSSLLLNRRSSAVGPTGVYTCVIPDAGNVLRTLTITITDGE